MNLKELKETDVRRYNAVIKLSGLLSQCKCDFCKSELIRLQKEFEIEPEKK